MTKVEINEIDILRGTPDDSCECAVARAVMNSSLCREGEKVRVESDGEINIWWYSDGHVEEIKLKHVNLDQQLMVEEFIYWYDTEYPDYQSDALMERLGNRPFTIELQR